MEFEEALIPIVMFLVIGFVFWVIARAGMAKAEARTRAQGQMLDKFSASPEFVSFLRTPEGKRYLDSLLAAPKRHPKAKIIAALQTGIIISFVGVGAMVLSMLAGFDRPIQEPPFLIGILILFVGFGFIASAVVAYLMSKQWGLLNGNAPDEQQT